MRLWPWRFWRTLAQRKRQAILDDAARRETDERDAARQRLLQAAQNDWASAPTQPLPRARPLMTPGAEHRAGKAKRRS